MNIYRYVGVILIIFYFSNSCSTKSELEYVYRQKVYNSKNIIYLYHYASNFPTNDGFGGIVVLDSVYKIDSETDFSKFKENEIDERIVKIDSNKNVTTVGFQYQENLESEKDSVTMIQKVKDLIIKKTIYTYTFGRKNEFEFDSLIENLSNITFNGAKSIIFQESPIVDSISVDKGGVFITDSNGIIKYISASKIIQRKTKTGIEYGTASYLFYPKDSMHVSELSDYGIFKKVPI